MGVSKSFAKILTEAAVPVELLLIPGVETEFLGHVQNWRAYEFVKSAREAAYEAMEVFLADLLEGS